MRWIVFLVINVFVIATVSAATNAPVSRAYDAFDMPVADLPEGCAPSDLSPKEKTSRPLVLSTEKHIRAFCEGELPGLLDYAATREMFILCFKEKDEVGIYGWRLATAESANALFAKASKEFAGRTADMKLWVNSDVVVLLWRDKGVTDSCFLAFQDHVTRTMKKIK